MKSALAVVTLAAIATLLLAPTASAQTYVTTGTPPFGSFSGVPDIIDNANLNVHYTIPILQKAGRGTDFSYSLGYDSSIWYQVNNGSKIVWLPVPAWGWSQGLASGGAYVLYSIAYQSASCGPPGYGYSYDEWTFSNFTFYDSVGTPHYFPASATYIQDNGGTLGCPTPGSSDPNGIVAQADVYTISLGPAGAGSISMNSLNGPSGGSINVPFVTTPPGLSVPTSSVTDRNGNKITVSNGVYTDTLDTTALTIANGTTTTYSYTAPSGGTATYTISYQTYTVRTNFGCSGTSEFGPTSESLVNKITLPDGSYYQFTYETTPGYSGDVTGRIASVRLPTGGTISYTYTGSNNGIECNGDGINSTAGLKRSTPDTGSGYWTYARTIGTYPNPDTTTITDPRGNQTVLTFPEYSLEETQRVVNQGSSTALEMITTTYQSGSYPVIQKTVTSCWPSASSSCPSGSGTLQSKTVTSYNSSELVTEVDEYAYGTGAPGSLVRKTLTSYASLGNGIVDMPASVTVEDGSSNVKAQTTYTYDQGSVVTTTGTLQHSNPSGSRGNATTIQYLVTGSTYLTKTNTYYDTGNIDVATDVNSGTTTYNYSNATVTCGNAFPSSVTEAISTLSQSMTWNCTGGVLLTATDENNQTVSSSYTNAYFWRPDSSTDQLSNTTNFTYTDATGSTGASVKSSLLFNSNNSATNNLVTLNGLGRVLVSQTEETPTGSTWDSVESDYDSLGRPDRATLPYTANSGITSSGAPATHTTYDALGRPTQITDNETTPLNLQFSYSQNDAYQTLGPAPSGENAKRKQYEYDALGRLTSVCEVTSLTGSGTCGQTNTATGYWTEYTYDLLNDLTGVTQNAQASSGSQQTRTYTYDDLGRITSETNPETGTTATTYVYDSLTSDPACGTVTYNGDLVKKVDQVGNTTCYAYDPLHRLTSVTYPNGSYASVTPSRHLVYDSATVNGVAMAYPEARLAEAYTCTGSCTSKLTDIGLSYTKRGEVSDAYESTPHSSGYYHVTQTYWANGVPDVLSNLTGLPTITYGVDAEGRVTSASASSGQNPLTSTVYNTASAPTTVNFGSSDSDTFSYDPNSARTNGYTFSVNSQSVAGTLTWNSIGTLETLAIVDPINSTNAQTCNYTHDDLSRIASDHCGSGWSQTFTYDAFGNINKSGTQSFQPNYSSSTNHMTSIGSYTPTYDANGNVTADSLNSYAWDSNGRPVTIDGVGATYDALGRMVEQNKSGTYYEIVYSPLGTKLAIMQGTTLQKAFVPLAGGATAVYNSSGLAYYRHSDWLGSSRLASTSTRTVYYDGAYGPFGEQYANSGTTDLSFTGMNQDTASNVYDFAAREYGIQGRWPSPDPAGPAAVDITNPQTWNRYCYVGNNPLAFIDPTGTCSLNVAVYGGLFLSNSQTKALESAFSQIFATAGVGVNFSFSGNPDYTFTVVPSETPMTYGLDAPVLAPSIALGSESAGYTQMFNHGSGYFDATMGFYALSSTSSALGAALGRVGAHEAGHYFLNMNHNPQAMSGLGGIMDAGIDATNPNLGFFPGQSIQLQQRCQKLHPPASSSRGGGGGGGGGSGFGGSGFGGGELGGGVDQGGGGGYVYWCVSGPIGSRCGWSRVE